MSAVATIGHRPLLRRVDFAVVPLLGFLGVFFVGPLLAVLALGFLAFDSTTFVSSGFTLEHFTRFVGDSFYHAALARSFGIAIATTAWALVLGYPIAYHLYTLRHSSARTLGVLIVLLPVTVSFVVTAFAWVVILGGNGLINQALLTIGVTDRPVKLLSTNSGVIIVLTYTFIPFMIMNIYSALETIDTALLRSASVLGAQPARVFRYVILPLSLPGVLSGSMLVFSLALGAFVTPIIIGGSQVKTIPVLIFNFATGVYDWPGAAALAVLFLVVSLVVTSVIARAFQRRFLAWLAPA